MNTGKLKKFASLTIQSINQLLWSPLCTICSTNICQSQNSLCGDCWSQLLACTNYDYCPRCGINVSKYAIVRNACPHCQADELHIDQIARCGVYDQALKKIILSFKFKDKTELISLLAMLANPTLAGSAFFYDIDFFVPVPLHWSRQLYRGYNQSLLLARQLKHPTAIINTDLVRIRRTRAQTTMVSPASRAKNVANAFAVRHRHSFENSNLCLVDDIKTTGATLNECAKTLKQAGAKKVFALVIAVASQKIQ